MLHRVQGLSENHPREDRGLGRAEGNIQEQNRQLSNSTLVVTGRVGGPFPMRELGDEAAQLSVEVMPAGDIMGESPMVGHHPHTQATNLPGE